MTREALSWKQQTIDRGRDSRKLLAIFLTITSRSIFRFSKLQTPRSGEETLSSTTCMCLYKPNDLSKSKYEWKKLRFLWRTKMLLDAWKIIKDIHHRSVCGFISTFNCLLTCLLILLTLFEELKIEWETHKESARNYLWLQASTLLTWRSYHSFRATRQSNLFGGKQSNLEPSIGVIRCWTLLQRDLFLARWLEKAWTAR